MKLSNINSNRVRKADCWRFDAVQVQLRPELLKHADFHDGWTEMRPRAAKVRSHEIVLTERDEDKLRRFVRLHRPYIAPTMLNQLEAELNRALLVDEKHIPANVVTMNSRVLYEDTVTGDLTETRLVYSEPMARGESHVSVLAPVGAALLGLSEGQSIRWPYGNDALHLRVAAVLYQPEAAGAVA